MMCVCVKLAGAMQSISGRSGDGATATLTRRVSEGNSRVGPAPQRVPPATVCGAACKDVEARKTRMAAPFARDPVGMPSFR
jgi:hypothetical protein